MSSRIDRVAHRFLVACLALAVVFPRAGFTKDASTAAALRSDLRAIYQLIDKDDFKAADDHMTAVVEDPGFSSLLAIEQRDALYTATMLALDVDAWKRGLALSIRATALGGDDKDLWHARFRAAFGADDMQEAALGLSAIADRWPSTLMDIYDRAIMRVVWDLRRSNDRASAKSWLRLVEALRGADWRFSNQLEPSALWRDLTQEYLERGDDAKAAGIATHVTDPLTLIGMRSDKRFDRVLAGNPLARDVNRAASDQIELLRAAARRSPQSLENRNDLALSLLLVSRNAEVLELQDESLRLMTTGTPAQPAFDDLDEQRVWVEDYKARALRALGRFDEALAVWVTAAGITEHGRSNVSQVINLGYYYCDLDRPREALAVIATVGRASAFGAMQVESVRHAAALELDDVAEAKRALGYLKDHQRDSPGTYQWALARQNDVGAGARLLIARLKNPKQRTDALADVQTYAQLQEPPRAEQWKANFAAVVARPDVQRAIAKFGRIGRYDIVSIG